MQIRPSIRNQRGMTLVEFMVAIVIGMLMVAALATLIANQSQSRAEIDKSGKLIENGRFALQTLSNDLQLAGYYGELGSQQGAPTATVDPCSTSATAISDALGMQVQGFDSPGTLPSTLAVCVKNHRPGTDVLVLRRADPETSDLESGGSVDWTKLKPGQVYLQTGLNASGVQFEAKVATADGSTDSTTFNLTKKDKVTKATPRRFLVRIYYVANCSVEVGGSCTGADGGDPIPTLKRVDLTHSGGSTVFTTSTIAEGIENMQVDYGLDTSADGVIDGADQGGGTCNAGAGNPTCTGSPLPGFTNVDWSNVMSVKVHLVARTAEKVAGFSDPKTYVLGTAGAASAPSGQEAYRRHVFVQSTRLVNPIGRRAF